MRALPGPASRLGGVAHGDTAGSAQYVAQTGDITKAAICSSRAAELYGLEILARESTTTATTPPASWWSPR